MSISSRINRFTDEAIGAIENMASVLCLESVAQSKSDTLSDIPTDTTNSSLMSIRADTNISKANGNDVSEDHNVANIICRGSDGKPVLKMQNVVARVELDTRLDLTHISKNCFNCEYNKQKLNAVIMRIRKPKTTALIFNSGKMMCTGAKTESNAMISARKFARIIQKLGYDVHFKRFTIVNIVGSFELDFNISFEKIELNQRGCLYEPELFPALTIKMVKPDLFILVFLSGKIIMTGARLRVDLEQGFYKLLPILISAKNTKSNI